VIDSAPKIGATHPTMPENAVSPTSNEEPELVGGEIVGIEESRIRVRLDSGTIGFIERPAAGEIRVGQRASFRTVTPDAGGPPRLAFAEREDAQAAEEPFDREVVDLHNALANHRPSNSVRPIDRVHLGEEQIQNWIGHVEGSLDRLRKNRAKRLNEEFYTGS
jgi:hypothetical protein